MPIVDYKLEQSVQSDGGSSNTLRMYDQDKNEYLISFSLSAGLDISPIIAQKIACQDMQLAKNEYQQIISGG